MTRQMHVRNPRTGVADYSIDAPDADEIAGIAATLRAAQVDWHAAGVAGRCDILRRWAEALLADAGAVTAALSTDTGRHLISVIEVQALRGIVEGWCARAPELLAEPDEWPSVTAGVGIRGQQIPYGVVGVISPWNFPFLLSMIDSIPALIAGCSVIVKPSEVTPRFIEPLQRSLATVPELAAVFRWITGDGQTGAALIDNVDAIAFTGSVRTGRIVGESAARAFIPCFLELGGKDPAIVLPEADLDLATRIVLRASVQATGQACQSLERIYVHESGYDEFVEMLVDKAEKVELSYPDPRAGHIGPLIFAQQGDIIAAHLADAVAKGAMVRTGGEVEELGGGLWIRPTVVTGVDHSMQLMTEETFGPVMPIMSYRTIDEAVELANDTNYGLSASVIGPDIDACAVVGRRIKAGAISINDGGMTTEVYDAPHDSFLLSGLGASRMGDTGITRFVRRRALLIRHAQAQGIDSLDERLMAN
ncbi:MAG: aldehyde dehydrogenase family protein [Gammaproteobacteria bacterium]|nr:MAG: aldehyde dehydrogenase family protein [Gammaproteobacteria bacterium]